MLLSHRYRFIFLKTRKTAGTSVEVDLARYLGPDDVITRIQPPIPGHEPRNFRSANPLRRWLKKSYHNHVPGRVVRDLAGRKVYDSYFKFCIEREPVSKCVSMWRMISAESSFAHFDPTLTWDEYVERGDFPVDEQIYLDHDGSLIVDRVLRYESLNEELQSVTGQLGIPFERLEARAKRASAVGPAWEVTPAQRQQIYDAFAPTLRFTAYADDGG